MRRKVAFKWQRHRLHQHKARLLLLLHLIPAAAVLVAALIVVGVLYYRSRSSKHLTEKDSIVLADFANKTGDPVFDDTLKQALAVDLGQSPFLNILSDRKVTATLRLMGRSPEQAVTGEVARELCQRVAARPCWRVRSPVWAMST